MAPPTTDRDPLFVDVLARLLKSMEAPSSCLLKCSGAAWHDAGIKRMSDLQLPYETVQRGGTSSTLLQLANTLRDNEVPEDAVPTILNCIYVEYIDWRTSMMAP